MADDPALIIAMPAIAIRDAGAAWAKTIARQMPVGDVVTKSDKTERSRVISVATRRSRERAPRAVAARRSMPRYTDQHPCDTAEARPPR